jgi:hypothetical protein
MKELYAVNKDNQTFLHSRLQLGNLPPVKHYKAIIRESILPSGSRKPQSILKAKKAVSDYRKVGGTPEGLAELSVYYCEVAFDFFHHAYTDQEAYCDALILMFEKAVNYVLALTPARKQRFLKRLAKVRKEGNNYGWGVEDAFYDAWTQTGLEQSDEKS